MYLTGRKINSFSRIKPISNTIFVLMHSVDFKVGLHRVLGELALSEEEIISYAEQFDPLYFHTNPEKAKSSLFKGLVASGSHIFKVFYSQLWVPIYGKTILAGLSVNKWNFLQPIYANEIITGEYQILSILETSTPSELIITWKFTFKNQEGKLAQSLELKILHNKDLI